MNEGINSQEGNPRDENLDSEKIKESLLEKMNQVKTVEDYNNAHTQYLIHKNKFSEIQQIDLEAKFDHLLVDVIKKMVEGATSQSDVILANDRFLRNRELFSDEDASYLEGRIEHLLGEFSNE